MPTFTPPVAYDVPRVLPERHRGDALLRHYSPLPRGRNVYLLDDGTITESQPGADGPQVAKVYFGGHIENITAAEAAALTAAGYGSGIT